MLTTDRLLRRPDNYFQVHIRTQQLLASPSSARSAPLFIVCPPVGGGHTLGNGALDDVAEVFSDLGQVFSGTFHDETPSDEALAVWLGAALDRIEEEPDRPIAVVQPTYGSVAERGFVDHVLEIAHAPLIEDELARLSRLAHRVVFVPPATYKPKPGDRRVFPHVSSTRCYSMPTATDARRFVAAANETYDNYREHQALNAEDTAKDEQHSANVIQRLIAGSRLAEEEKPATPEEHATYDRTLHDLIRHFVRLGADGAHQLRRDVALYAMDVETDHDHHVLAVAISDCPRRDLRETTGIEHVFPGPGAHHTIVEAAQVTWYGSVSPETFRQSILDAKERTRLPQRASLPPDASPELEGSLRAAGIPTARRQRPPSPVVNPAAAPDAKRGPFAAVRQLFARGSRYGR